MVESIIYVICDIGGWPGTLAAASADCCNSKITLMVVAWWMGVTKATQASWSSKRIRNNRHAWHNNVCAVCSRAATFECPTAGNWRTRLVQ